MFDFRLIHTELTELTVSVNSVPLHGTTQTSYSSFVQGENEWIQFMGPGGDQRVRLWNHVVVNKVRNGSVDISSELEEDLGVVPVTNTDGNPSGSRPNGSGRDDLRSEGGTGR